MCCILQVQKGDLIGFTANKALPLTYKDKSCTKNNQVINNSNAIYIWVGDAGTFTKAQGECRDYSVQATVQKDNAACK